jgi:hypothetical protein
MVSRLHVGTSRGKAKAKPPIRAKVKIKAKVKAAQMKPANLQRFRLHRVPLTTFARLMGEVESVEVFAKRPPRLATGAAARPHYVMVEKQDVATYKQSATAVVEKAFAPGPRALAILRGREIAARDLEESGGSYNLEQVQTLLHGISRQRIYQLVKEGRLLSIPGPHKRPRFPVVQFSADGRLVDGLKDVRGALPTKNPWALLNFLIHRDDRLQGARPIELLRRGSVAAVVEAAARMSEPGM